ncbi:MAG: hypothetical protein H6559_20050 [Lewinellaceae bacterium]|nr:hypothetical protein [Lewinellaceae bacterium]
MSYCHRRASASISITASTAARQRDPQRDHQRLLPARLRPPSCEDGIQNGDETGVDCGGSSCPACPTCSDGVQNGDETGVDCGGSSCPVCPCFDNPVTLTIVLDNYPEETSWEIRNASNTVVASGGTYGSSPDGSTVVENACLPDGCYDFIIYDSYGDGICCAYGAAPTPSPTIPAAGPSPPAALWLFRNDQLLRDRKRRADLHRRHPERRRDRRGLRRILPALPGHLQYARQYLSASPTNTDATLTWNAPPYAIDYNVRAREIGTSTWTEGFNLTSPVSYTGLIYLHRLRIPGAVQLRSGGVTSAWSSSSFFSTTGCGGCTYQTLDFNNFETTWGIWNDGGSDA